MNREIKFRGKGYHGWFYGYLQKYHEKYSKRICICPVSIRTWKDALIYEVKEETIGQLTCLQDKDGNEIYEDDLLKTLNGTIVLVEWVEGGFKITNIKDTMSTACLSKRIIENLGLIVIGNIHDNSNYLGEQPCETKQ